METRKIIISGLAGGLILFVLQFAFSFIAAIIAPYDVLALGGMRAVNDPIMALFFAEPFVLAFAAAIAFSVVRGSFPGPAPDAGIRFGLMLFLLITIPNTFVIFTSMNYPPGFHISNILFGVVGFPIAGMIYTTVWEQNK
jgi:hypothetical protein